VKVPDSWQQVKRRGAPAQVRRVLYGMTLIPALALAADTLLFRPVGVPTPWYSVASGVLSIVVTILLLGIAVALLGMARALKAAEHGLGHKMQGLTEELVPLARNLNHIATQLADVTAAARGDLARLSGTVGAVDDAVRSVIAAGEERFAHVATLLDALQDEADNTVASATGIMRGVRTGAGSLASNLFGGRKQTRERVRRRTPDHDLREPADLDDDEIRERLAVLESALADRAADDDQDEEDADEFDDDVEDDEVEDNVSEADVESAAKTRSQSGPRVRQRRRS
jgi:hypothetical protein